MHTNVFTLNRYLFNFLHLYCYISTSPFSKSYEEIKKKPSSSAIAALQLHSVYSIDNWKRSTSQVFIQNEFYYKTTFSFGFG